MEHKEKKSACNDERDDLLSYLRKHAFVLKDVDPKVLEEIERNAIGCIVLNIHYVKDAKNSDGETGNQS